MIERALVEAATQLRARGEPHVVATVVRVTGSAYRRPGARMVITRDGGWVGCVSGGCLEDDLRRRAWWLTEQGPALVRYDSSVDPDADVVEVREAVGLGCGGVVEILVERANLTDQIDPLALAAMALRDQQRCAVATVFRSEVAGITAGTRIALVRGAVHAGCDTLPDPVRDEIVAMLHGVLEHARATSLTFMTPQGVVDVLVEQLRPPPRLFVFGANHDVIPIAQLARHVGWDLVLCSRHARTAMLDGIASAAEVVLAPPAAVADRVMQADRAFAVVMNHSLDTDRECLEMLLASRVGYIGVLGPRARTRQLLATLGRAAEDPRIHAPVGLELGAETPAEIALAIISEIQATLVRAPAVRLRDRTQPLHPPTDGVAKRIVAT